MKNSFNRSTTTTICSP